MITLAALRAHCLAKPGTSEDLPFDEETLVFKVKGKMFALTSLQDSQLSINLKCDPERALELRDSHDAVQPGYHMNKRHWNTVGVDGTIPDALILEWVDDSYALVVKGLKKADRDALLTCS